MNTTTKIKNILNEEIKGYRELIDLLQKEKECLINLDTAGIENVYKEKDTVILKLRLLDEERINLLKRLSQENNTEKEMTLQRLYKLTGDETLKNMRLQLISMLQSIEELNEFNGILIERSLSFIRNSLAFLKASGIDTKISEATLSRKA
jgi:flagellar biosynthesis/type III secretory pathway chaperone